MVEVLWLGMLRKMNLNVRCNGSKAEKQSVEIYIFILITFLLFAYMI